jgi:hypothetical protein
LSNVALFLHSTIRMHCLLQKLEGELTVIIWLWDYISHSLVAVVEK